MKSNKLRDIDNDVGLQLSSDDSIPRLPLRLQCDLEIDIPFDPNLATEDNTDAAYTTLLLLKSYYL